MQKSLSINTKDIALIGLMLSIIEVAKSALGFIAGVEVVTLLFIICTLFFGKKMIYMLFGFYIVEGVMYGFTIWWFMYVYIWALFVFITYLLRKHKSVLFWSFMSGLYGLAFGLLCSLTYIITNGLETAITWWIAGIPTDVIHGVSNFIICMILFKPLNRTFKIGNI